MLKNSIGPNTSTGQGISLENHLEGRKNSAGKVMWSHSLIKTGDEFVRFGCNFKILSPSLSKLNKLLTAWETDRLNSNTSAGNKDYDDSFQELLNNDKFIEDRKPHNGSSLAFIFEFHNKKILLLGDSHPTVIAESIEELGYTADKRLCIDYVKISHHGSKANTNDALLSLIDSENFIISTNGNFHGLPNKKTLARIVAHFPNANLMFNYPELINEIFTEDEISNASFNAVACEGIIHI